MDIPAIGIVVNLGRAVLIFVNGVASRIKFGCTQGALLIRVVIIFKEFRPNATHVLASVREYHLSNAEIVVLELAHIVVWHDWLVS